MADITKTWRLTPKQPRWMDQFICYMWAMVWQALMLDRTSGGHQNPEESCPPYARELNVHFTSMSYLQCCFLEIGSTSNWPHNHILHVFTSAQDLHIQLLHLQSETGHPDNWCNIGFAKLSESDICLLVVLTRVLTILHLFVEASSSMVSVTLEKCSLHGWIVVCTVPERWQKAWIMWVSGWLMSTSWTECAMVIWYGQAAARMTNTGLFYWWQFTYTDILMRCVRQGVPAYL